MANYRRSRGSLRFCTVGLYSSIPVQGFSHSSSLTLRANAYFLPTHTSWQRILCTEASKFIGTNPFCLSVARGKALCLIQHVMSMPQTPRDSRLYYHVPHILYMQLELCPLYRFPFISLVYPTKQVCPCILYVLPHLPSFLLIRSTRSHVMRGVECMI